MTKDNRSIIHQQSPISPLRGIPTNEFAQDWPASETETRMLCELLGLLEDDELLVKIPNWLAKKVSYTEGATPTEFVGVIERETEKAILLSNSASARPLAKLAHWIHQLQQSSPDASRNEWLDERLEEVRAEYERRDDVVKQRDGWLPKS